MGQPLDPTARELRRVSREVNRHKKILDSFNGGIDSIKQLKEMLPQLRLLAQNAPTILALADARAQDEIFWQGLKKRLSPFKLVGFLFWAIVTGGISAIAYEVVRFKISGHFS